MDGVYLIQNMFITIRKINEVERGSVLLITMVIITMILTLGAGMISIATKQTILSSIGRESQKAFYAADSGIECVLYWELQSVDSFQFATSSDSSVNPPSGDFCGGQDMSPAAGFTTWSVSADATSATTTFLISAWSEDYSSLDMFNPCVKVVLEKRGASTEVLSTGYNTCDTTSGRRVSRAVHINY